jgi:hypothetical protein
MRIKHLQVFSIANDEDPVSQVVKDRVKREGNIFLLSFKYICTLSISLGKNIF